jgi:hypothetical protein
MKCAATITVISIALVSQAFAVLRPLFPAKSAPPFNGGAIATGDHWIRNLPKKAQTLRLRDGVLLTCAVDFAFQ